MISIRMRRARLAAGLTLDEVVEKLGHAITKAGLSKYERGKSTPSADFLAQLAKVLGVRTSHFLEEPSVRIEWIAFRKHSQLGRRKQDQIRAFAEKRVEAQLWLRAVLYPDEAPAKTPRTPVSMPEDAERAADVVRKAWQLSDLPIESVTATFEDRGGVVVGWSDHNRFDGLSGWANGRVLLVVLNHAFTDDRRRFDLAHELGHLSMKLEEVTSKEEEGLAHRFAAAFLVPADTARRELGSSRRSLDLEEIGLLKQKYGFSMQAWIRRAYDLGIISHGHYQRLNVLFRKRGWHRHEPVEFHGREEPTRFRLMARHALAEGLVSRQWVESACPEALEREDISLPSARGDLAPLRLARMSLAEQRAALERAAEQVAEEYSKDEELTDWETLDAEEPMTDEAG
jgi:Zn-dependent peptidase ImmA (M78 family)